MQEVATAAGGSKERTSRTSTAYRVAAAVLIVVAAATLLLRLPDTFRQFDGQAAKNAVGGDNGRLLATADSIDVDNDFVLAAVQTLPRNATYTVQLPPNQEVAASSYGIGAVTLSALVGYMRFILLPRLDVPPDAAQYVLCYACDTAPWDHRTSWLWKNDHAVAIGKVNRP
jgi:hypothetical protein